MFAPKRAPQRGAARRRGGGGILIRNKNIQNRHSSTHTQSFLVKFYRYSLSQRKIHFVTPSCLLMSLSQSAIGRAPPGLPVAALAAASESSPTLLCVKSMYSHPLHLNNLRSLIQCSFTKCVYIARTSNSKSYKGNNCFPDTVAS